MICGRTPRPLCFVGLGSSRLLLALRMKILGVEEKSEHYDHLVRERTLEESVFRPCLNGLMRMTSNEDLALVAPTMSFSWCLDSTSLDFSKLVKWIFAFVTYLEPQTRTGHIYVTDHLHHKSTVVCANLHIRVATLRFSIGSDRVGVT